MAAFPPSLALNVPPRALQGRARVVAITSGKGGVGKTLVSANLAAALAQRGLRVLVIDADLGLANLDVVLNLQPQVTLHDVLLGTHPVHAAVVPAPMGFSVLLAGSGLVEYSRLTDGLRQGLQRVMQAVASQFDVVLLDTGAGISDVVLFTLSMADEVLVVATPEPTSLTDAYATIKVVSTLQQRNELLLLINQVTRAGEGLAIRNQLQTVVDRYLGALQGTAPGLRLLAELPQDAAARDAVRRRSLVLQTAPGSALSQALTTAAARLEQWIERRPVLMRDHGHPTDRF